MAEPGGRVRTVGSRRPVNFIGHSLFAFGRTDLMVGQFAGDFVRGRALSSWPRGMAAGIRLHRLLDARTDAHPELVALRRAFPAPLRRYAGIALDVALDHHLARDWGRVVSQDPALPDSLAAQAAAVDRALRIGEQALGPHWPGGLARLHGALRDQRLFERWATRAGLERTLERIAARSPRLAPLSATMDTLEALDERLAQVPDTLLPHLRDACRARLARSEDAVPPTAETVPDP